MTRTQTSLAQRYIVQSASFHKRMSHICNLKLSVSNISKIHQNLCLQLPPSQTYVFQSSRSNTVTLSCQPFSIHRRRPSKPSFSGWKVLCSTAMDQTILEDVSTSKTVLASSVVSKSPKCFGSGSAEPSWKMDWIDLVALWSRGSLLNTILIKFSTSNCWTPATWTEYKWMLFPISFLKWIQYNLTDIVILFVKLVLPLLPMLPNPCCLQDKLPPNWWVQSYRQRCQIKCLFHKCKKQEKKTVTYDPMSPRALGSRLWRWRRRHLPTCQQSSYETRARDTASHFFPA